MSGSVHLTNRLDWQDVAEMQRLFDLGIPQNKIAQQYNIAGSSVGRILDKTKWTSKQKIRWAKPTKIVEGTSFVATIGDRCIAVEKQQSLPTVSKLSLYKQVCLFNDLKTHMENTLGELQSCAGVSDALHNEMVDELLEVLAEWKL